MSSIEIAQGRLAGRTLDGIDAYLGIPFATAPRFRAPGPAPAWTGVRDATVYGPEAPQDSVGMDERLGASGQRRDEECLNLNVWRPTGAAGDLPVMVWIHGGGFSYGSAGHPLFDGAALARRGNVVLVSLQYRLGVLGLLWHPALGEPEAPFDGNWAMQDLVAGLRWVRDNAAAFGGDAGNVTIFGESAGGVAVAQLALSPYARPLIRRAIVQSASPKVVDRAQHERAAADFIAAAGIAADAGTLRALPVDAVLRAQPAWVATVAAGRAAPRPMVDGDLLPDWPNAIAERGELRDLDILVSYTGDEFNFQALAASSLPRTDADVIASLRADDLPPELFETYRAARREAGLPDDPLSLWVALRSDALLRVPALDFLARHTAQGGRGYACAVTWGSPWAPEKLGKPLGACHLIELPPLFGTYAATPELKRLSGPGAAACAPLIQDAWLAFARTGNPATPATGDWPMFTADDRATMCLDTAAQRVSDPWGVERAAMQNALDARAGTA